MSKSEIDSLMLELEKDPQYAEWAESYDDETIERMQYRIEESSGLDSSYFVHDSDWMKFWACSQPPCHTEEERAFFERYCY